MVAGPRDSTTLTPSGSTPPVSIRGGANFATSSATLMRAFCPSGETASARASLMVTVSMTSSSPHACRERPPWRSGRDGTPRRAFRVRRNATEGVPYSWLALLAGAPHEHQHLTGTHHGVVARLDAVDNGVTLRVDVEAV